MQGIVSSIKICLWIVVMCFQLACTYHQTHESASKEEIEREEIAREETEKEDEELENEVYETSSSRTQNISEDTGKTSVSTRENRKTDSQEQSSKSRETAHDLQTLQKTKDSKATGAISNKEQGELNAKKKPKHPGRQVTDENQALDDSSEGYGVGDSAIQNEVDNGEIGSGRSSKWLFQRNF